MLMKPVQEPRRELRNEVLTEAQNQLKRHGWCQGQGRNWRGNLCAIGALTWADGITQGLTEYGLKAEWGFERSEAYSDAVHAAHMVLADRGVQIGSLPDWNDNLAPGWFFNRGKQQVLDLFEAAKAYPLEYEDAVLR